MQLQRNYSPSTGYLTSITGTLGSSTTTFWTVQQRAPDGQLTRGLYGNGLTESRSYDSVGRLMQEGANFGTTPVRAFTYGRYVDGSVEDRVDGVQRRYDGYAYDSLHRLTQWGIASNDDSISQSLSYQYDILGNLDRVTGSGGNSSGGSWSLPTETDCYGASTTTSGYLPHALLGASTTSTTCPFDHRYDDRGRRVLTPSETVSYNSFDLPSAATR